MTIPVDVISEPLRRASPKSMILTLPLGRMWMLAGLRSRWTMSRAWAKARPSQICSIAPIFSSRLIFRPPRACLRSRPSSSSIAMKSCSFSRPSSYTVMMFGCMSLAAASASRRKRLRTISSASRPAEMTFTATSRFRAGSWARNTSPMAPWPILPTISYLPIRLGCNRADLTTPRLPVSDCTMMAP